MTRPEPPLRLSVSDHAPDPPQSAPGETVDDSVSDVSAHPVTEAELRTMYEEMSDHIEAVRESLRIDMTDSVYQRCITDLRNLRDGRFDRISETLENLRALVDTLTARLALVEGSVPVSTPSPTRHLRGPTSEQVAALSTMAAEINSRRKRAERLERNGTPPRAEAGSDPSPLFRPTTTRLRYGPLRFRTVQYFPNRFPFR